MEVRITPILALAILLSAAGGATQDTNLGTPTDEFRVKRKPAAATTSTNIKPAKKQSALKTAGKATKPPEPQKQTLSEAESVAPPEPQRSTTDRNKEQTVSAPSRVSTVYSRNPSFNTDYKTRGASANIPVHLHGSGLNGHNIPIGSEDPYRKTLPADYMPSDLVLIPQEWCYYKMPLYLRKEAADSLLRMFSDAAREGHRLYIFSGYRDYRHQQRLYAEAVRRNGPNQKGVAKPGRSEHALGTTADVTNGSKYLMKRSFAETPEGKWLMQNASRYGWKMTVMAGNGRRSHSDEPWHIRYLGNGQTPSHSIAQSQSIPGRIIRAPGSLLGSFKKSLSKVTDNLTLKKQLNGEQSAPGLQQ